MTKLLVLQLAMGRTFASASAAKWNKRPAAASLDSIPSAEHWPHSSCKPCNVVSADVPASCRPRATAQGSEDVLLQTHDTQLDWSEM